MKKMISERKNNTRSLIENMRSKLSFDSCGADCKRTTYKTVHSMRCSYGVVVGSRWQEVDKRFERIVEVVKIEGNKIHIKTIMPARSTTTVAKLERFNGRSSGYRYFGSKCHECQLSLGAVVPKGDLRGVTVTLGRCSHCLKENKTLVPSCDYHWPQQGRKAVFD